MDGIRLHPVGPDDVALLMAVPEGLFDEPMRADQARAFIADEHSLMFLAFDGDLAAGMASGTIVLHPDKAPSLFINEVGVRQSHQRRGIGTALTQALIGAARRRGLEGIWLGTEMDNAPARALYRSLGGQEVIAALYSWDDAI